MKSPQCDDKSLLMGYLYGECDDAERERAEEHLLGCPACQSELEQLRGVRVALRDWAPPEQALGFRIVREEPTASHAPAADGRVIRPRVSRWLPARVPAWAQAAAAVLVLALGAGIANLDVRVGNGGVTIRTGWQQAEQARVVPVQQGSAGVSRADLAALEQQLRREIASATTLTAATPGAATTAPTVKNVAAPTLSPSEQTAMLKRVEMLVDDIERRKQRDFDRQLAERFLRFSRDMTSQRAADLLAIQQGLSEMNSRTTELGRVQNYMLRVANVQQEIK